MVDVCVFKIEKPVTIKIRIRFVADEGRSKRLVFTDTEDVTAFAEFVGFFFGFDYDNTCSDGCVGVWD